MAGSGSHYGVYFEKIRVLNTGKCLNKLAWDNKIRMRRCTSEPPCQWLIEMIGGVHIAPLEVKFLDRSKMYWSEGVHQGRFHWSRTKVKGSKTIRYRRSLNYKLYHPAIGLRFQSTPPAACEKLEILGSRGSMVARLKLKGIDGKAHQEWSLRLNLTQHGETYQVQT